MSPESSSGGRRGESIDLLTQVAPPGSTFRMNAYHQLLELHPALSAVTKRFARNLGIVSRIDTLLGTAVDMSGNRSSRSGEAEDTTCQRPKFPIERLAYAERFQKHSSLVSHSRHLGRAEAVYLHQEGHRKIRRRRNAKGERTKCSKTGDFSLHDFSLTSRV